MNRKAKLSIVSALTISAGLIASTAAIAGGTLTFGDDKWISIGAGLRTSFNAIENGSADGGSYSKDFKLDSIRLYVNGSVNKYFKVTFNTERQDDDSLRVLDAIARLEVNDQFNVWAGRMLSPSDRANLDGPYYLSTWNFPFTSNYPAIFAGRDDGAAVWGETGVGSGHFKYQFGASQGCHKGGACDTGANGSDKLLYSGRLTYNFWDDEPGYYASSDYYGSKDVLAIGLVGQYQSDAVGTSSKARKFFGWNLDALMDKKLDNGGVVNLEGAYYQYNADVDPVNRGGLYDGNSWFALAGYLFPQKVWIGQFQPHVRYQYLDNNDVGKTKQWEMGVNYIIEGHNARVSLVGGSRNDDPDGGKSEDNKFVQLGVQLQI